MKMNKLAAGALALALGLGAVAPAVAAENGTGTNIVEHEYNEQLIKVQKYFEERNEARKVVEAAKARYEAAKKAAEDAEKKYKELPADKDDAAAGDIDTQIAQAAAAVTTAKSDVATAVKNYNTEYDKKENANKDTLETLKVEVTKKTKALDEAVAKHAELVKKKKEGLPEIDKNKLAPKAQALVDLVKAQQELANAYGAYGIALDNEKALTDKFDDEFKILKSHASAVGDILRIEDGKVVVKPAKPAVKKDNIEELKRAREEALTAIKAVKLLKELSPEKIKNVEAKLNALVAKNEALVKKADAKIAAAEKKVAFIATAYADEEADDTDALIKELDSTTSEIKELIKDKPEEKKPEEKKPEEKKPEEKTPSKKAGNNARTGIAGVAGVAGILAAASVAYAASKRD